MSKNILEMLLLTALMAGCGNAIKSNNALWQSRQRSLGTTVNVGDSLEQVLEIWGQPERVTQSVIGEVHFGTLHYERYVNRHGVRFNSPIESYSLHFEDGRLASWHSW